MNDRTLSLFKDLFRAALIASITLSSAVGCAVAPKKSTPIPIANDPQVGVGTASATTSEVNPTKAKPKSDGIASVSKADVATLKTLNERYRSAKSITMNVEKNLKLGLIGSERKSSGTLMLSKGQVRMELQGSEKTLLVVNKKNLFAVTYPDPALKGAAVQVIRGDVSSKKAQSQSITSLLGAGGFLKNFKPTAMQVGPGGEKIYFLQPTNDQSEFKRAQIVVANTDKEIQELRYWDARDNETTLKFSNVKFGAPIDAKQFNYTPPADADVMNL